MDGYGIMNACTDALIIQEFEQLITSVHLANKKVPNRNAITEGDRQLQPINGKFTQFFNIHSCKLTTALIPVVHVP